MLWLILVLSLGLHAGIADYLDTAQTVKCVLDLDKSVKVNVIFSSFGEECFRMSVIYVVMYVEMNKHKGNIHGINCPLQVLKSYLKL